MLVKDTNTVAKSSTAVTVSPSNVQKAILGLTLLAVIDKSMSVLFKIQNWNFPPALAGMVSVFGFLSAVNVVDEKKADAMAMYMGPAVAFLKAWLPFFFVPPLVVLPLKMDLLKGRSLQLASLIVSGAFLSLASAGVIAEGLLRLFPVDKSVNVETTVQSSPLPALPTLDVPAKMAALFLVLGTLIKSAVSVSNPVKNAVFNAFAFSATATGFILGTKIPAQAKKLVHPVLTCAAATISMLSTFGVATGQCIPKLLVQYFGSGSGKGAGDLISSVLGPAIVSFGLQLYQYRNRLKADAGRVLTTTAFSAGFGLTSSALLARALALYPKETALAPLTRCITTPLALAGARLTGADPSLSAFIGECVCKMHVCICMYVLVDVHALCHTR
jgi:putative effector of murein hydrolase/putative effector of murein hydrolase LrgA (UPF0299 family)